MNFPLVESARKAIFWRALCLVSVSFPLLACSPFRRLPPFIDARRRQLNAIIPDGCLVAVVSGLNDRGGCYWYSSLGLAFQRSAQ
ncbi:hypothetical protein FJV46_14995 [Arthrobacter agilis]|uniref:hypothetical protein n=1 Tax=Arthrobacter agilis TaxID=37921 RepID=UPI000F7DFF55|nr:hypothetical protein [Arthrobacter agilis]TPV21364.1 hypothetical protein FJV46_14995 [Arthrobacter agilis]